MPADAAPRRACPPGWLDANRRVDPWQQFGGGRCTGAPGSAPPPHRAAYRDPSSRGSFLARRFTTSLHDASSRRRMQRQTCACAVITNEEAAGERRAARGFLCLCALAQAAVASPPAPTAPFEPARLTWPYCLDGWSAPAGVHSAYRLDRPTVLGAELLDECMFANGLVPGEWFTPPPSGRAPMAAPVRAAGPIWGVVSELRLGVLSHDLAFTGRAGLDVPEPAPPPARERRQRERRGPLREPRDPPLHRLSATARGRLPESRRLHE